MEMDRAWGIAKQIFNEALEVEELQEDPRLALFFTAIVSFLLGFSWLKHEGALAIRHGLLGANASSDASLERVFDRLASLIEQIER